MKSEADPGFYSQYVGIGAYIVGASKQFQMAWTEFADFCGVSPSTINTLEAPGTGRVCTPDFLFRIAATLKVDVTDILSFELPEFGTAIRQP